MNKRWKSFSFICLLWTATSYAADCPPCDKPVDPCKEVFNHRVEVGGNYTRVDMKPDGNPSFSGNLGGAQGLYEYRPTNGLYAGARLSWKQGDMTGHSGKRSLLYIDAHERIGVSHTFGKNEHLMTLFTGFGYKRLEQTLTPNTGSSVEFTYNEFYVPLGLMGSCDATSWFNIGLGVTWMPQVFPSVSIVPLKGNNWSLTRSLYNFYVDLPLTFSWMGSKRFFFVVKPFYEYWKNGHSTAKTVTGLALGLPGNTYNFYGVDLNIGYRF